ncbi:hypothetical protein ABEB36_009790 [Hypothenemus hampei]|uniref:Uncharacterized protein n=1 Tax=Hypothenemus hampei TaxID=57062 RepID=A0ABD1EHG7_HYPHA
MECPLLVLNLVLVIITLTNGEETFANSSNLCQRCQCPPGSDFLLDCERQNFHHMIGNWPDHNQPLIATFSFNNITNLETLPSSDLAQKIVLSYCGIKTMDTGVFKGVKNLKFLDLSYNLLTTENIGPDTFKGPYNNTVYEPLALEDLIFSYNQIHSLPHNIFEHLPLLKQLNLEGNRLKVLDPPTQLALSGLRNLEVLNLANNELTELVGSAIESLQMLRILNLSKNKLDFVPSTLVLLSASLEVLNLDSNLIFEINDNSFLGVKGIQTLSLKNLPRLQYVNANAFSPLKNLSILHLSNNPNLTSIDQEAFGENQTLLELYLNNNSLEDLHYNLTKWSALRFFTLNDNELYCDCDLYEISRDLRLEIKRSRDGPYCINPTNDTSIMIYDLTEEACEFERKIYRLSHVFNSHFEVMKLIFAVSLTVVILMGFVTVTIVFLRYRRRRMNQNYPFISQVLYNPLRNSSHIYI